MNIYKDLIIDDFVKEIKDNKLQISGSLSSQFQFLEKKSIELSNQKKSELLETNKITNKESLVHLKCLGKHKIITELSIKNKNIIKIFHTFFTNLSNLKIIDLSNNPLGKVSKKFKNFEYLRVLKLNFALISAFPSFLKDMKYLEELHLENNKIEFIPSSIQNFKKLKVLNLSQNNIDKLPIEIGLIPNLQNLYIDKNEFSEIPTSLCYLEKLKNLKLEWFEFLDPALSSEQTDLVVLSELKDYLKEKLFNSEMYVDLQPFIIRLSKNVQNSIDETLLDSIKTDAVDNYSLITKHVFNALNNNYLGVIKSFINDNSELINTKDQNGKSLLYLSIHQKKKIIYDFLLSKIDVRNIPNNYTLVYKAVRLYNFPLVVKLVKMGVPLNEVDYKGNNIFHILFSVFNKNFDQCYQIGNFLIENNITSYNDKNKDGWAPIHIASKYSNYLCFEWIGEINKILQAKNKEIININALGRKNWTPFHLTCSTYKYLECIALLKLGANLLQRTSDGKLPKNTTNNFIITKMLNQKEKELFNEKYNTNNGIININVNKKSLLRSAKYSSKSNKISFTMENYLDMKKENKNNYVSSERDKSEIICSDNQFNLYDKYQTFMMISLSNNKMEIIKCIRKTIGKINYNIFNNYIMMCDILSLIQINNLFELKEELKNQIKIIKSIKAKNNNFLLRQINCVIKYLEKLPNKRFNRLTSIGYSNRKNLFGKNASHSVFMSKIKGEKYNLKNDDRCEKVFIPSFQKLKEKKVQESINSIDLED